MTAPVAVGAILPCSPLKPWDLPRKYAGLLLEQPMPESLITLSGLIDISKHAAIS